jgi:serine/threonine protein kinase
MEINYYELKDIEKHQFKNKVYFGKYDRLKLDIVLKKIEEKNKNEIDVHEKIHCHPNIIGFYRITNHNEIKYLVLEKAEMNLREYLNYEYEILDWKKKIKISLDIMRGIVYLHNLNIIHRDIQPNNILCCEDGNVFKISSFGLSRFEEVKYETECKRNAAYCDPEYIMNPNFKISKKSDVYSFGVLMWEISTGKRPFEGYLEDCIAVIIYQRKREKISKETPDYYSEIIDECWNQEYEKRPDSKKVFRKLYEVNENYDEIEGNDYIFL